MKNVITVLVLLLALAACRKPGNGYHPPATHYTYFEKASLTHFAPFRLYTRDGAVADAALAQRYFNEFNNYFYTTAASYSDPSLSAFTMVSEDSMINGTIPAGELKRVATGVYDHYKGNNYVIANDTSGYLLHIAGYKLFKPVTPPGGFTYFEVESPMAILKHAGDTLFFPIIRPLVISRTGNGFSFSSDRLNNTFDPSGVRKLGAHDTLLVQTFDLAMKKVVR